ncbi:MAG: hypothetical protein IJV69_00740 [Kiritimatiellae bacterium]|nr:hypothetical protein [Kiritimatiellia bacterium]
MKILSLITLLSLTTILLAAEKQQPTITYQGRLQTTSGTSTLLNQTIPIRFALYTQAEGGTALWRETVAVTPTETGFFTATLFEGCGSKIDTTSKTFAEALIQGRDNNGLWLGLTIGEGSTKELIPRHAIGIVPQAHRARFTYRAPHNFDVPNALTAAKLDATVIDTPTCNINTDNGSFSVTELDIRDTLTAEALTADGTIDALDHLILRGTVTSPDLVPMGAVILWYGNKDALPEGWEICGELSGRFPMGANDSYKVGTTGGSASVTLTLSQMPSHTHTLHYTDPNSISGYTALATDVDWNEETWVGESTKTVTLEANSPSGQAFNRLPPYKALYYIRRTTSTK